MAGGKGYLTAEEFVFVFFSAQELVADGSKINLTESMQLARAAGPGSLSKGGDSSSDDEDDFPKDDPEKYLRLGKYLVEKEETEVEAPPPVDLKPRMVCKK